jgi:hypothetical protein
MAGHCSDRHGAYGFELRGVAVASSWLAPVPAGSPTLELEVAVGATVRGSSRVEADRADISLVGGARLRMRRGDPRARFTFPGSPPPELDLLHPYLAPAAALAQLWAGNEALHAGAFVAPAGAVLVLAGKEGGKSTTLAWLATELGLPVLADDLAVIVRGSAVGGPRCLDLRPGAGAAGDAGTPGDPVRDASRLRVPLGPAPPATPLAGGVVLEWGPAAAAAPVAAAERLRELARARMYGASVTGDPAALLELAALPMVRVRRPRGESGLSAAAALIRQRFS